MKISIFISCVACLFILSACQSNAERAIDKAEELANEYIYELNNARTKEEVKKIRQEYKERTSFEIRKIMGAASDQEAEQMLMESQNDLEWEDIQRAKRIGEEIERAEKNAVRRTY